MNNTPALALENITVTFAARSAGTAAYTAVRDTTLVVERGEFVSVVGPTGCGKSTLLNIAAGLLAPSAGRVSIFGEPLVGLNRKAGYLFQADALMPWMSALDNVAVGLVYRGTPRAEALEKVALEDEYFIKRRLYPNVDFYSGIVYKALGIPVPLTPELLVGGRVITDAMSAAAHDFADMQLAYRRTVVQGMPGGMLMN